MRADALAAAEPPRADQVAAIAAGEDARLLWRHVLLLLVALTAMTLAALGVAGSVWTPAAHLLGSSASRLRGLAPALLVVYLLTAPVAAWAWARFDARAAVRRLPLVLVLGVVGVVALLGIIWLQAGGVGSYAAGFRADVADAELQTVASNSTPNRPLVQAASAEPTTLAAALVNPDEAAAILGAPVGPAEVPRRFLMRGASLCRYRTLDRAATLSILVKRSSGGPPRRLPKKADPIADLGDRAAATDKLVWVAADGWILLISIYRRDRRPVARQPLINGARHAALLLPPFRRAATRSS